MALTATEENSLAAKLDGVAASSRITISITSADSRWNDAVYAVGAGDMLVRSGQTVQGLGTAAAPRTAFGITAEGKLVFYTVDGRQTGYSNGMGMNTLAERMKSLGCVEAVNLDGGGSTAMTAQYPGFGTTETVNRPSDGSLRKCANYILFINKAAQTATPASLHLYPSDPIVLANSLLRFDVKAADSGYYPAILPAGISYSVDSRLGTVDQNGVFTAGGDEGRLYVSAAEAGLTGKTSVTVVKAPTSVSLVNASSGASVTSIKAYPLQTIDLNTVCYFNGVKMISSDTAVKWEISSDVGNIGSISVIYRQDILLSRSCELYVPAEHNRHLLTVQRLVGSKTAVLHTLSDTVPICPKYC
jgi:hypothetical protein